MISKQQLPPGIMQRLGVLTAVLEQEQQTLFAYLFGSAARDALRPLSDIDIAVYLADAADNAEAKLRLVGLIADTLGTDEFDLVILNTAPLSLSGRILRHRHVILDREPFLRHAYESRIMREFFDFSRKEREILFRRFA